jgi:hypothetical protein
VPDVSQHRDLPAGLARLVTDLLAKEPGRRPGDEAVIARLQALRDQLG